MTQTFLLYKEMYFSLYRMMYNDNIYLLLYKTIYNDNKCCVIQENIYHVIRDDV